MEALRSARSRTAPGDDLPVVNDHQQSTHPLERVRRGINLSLAVGVFCVGAAGGGWLITHKPEVPRASNARAVTSVAAARITPQVEDTPIVGFGTVRPKQQVSIHPQVAGALKYAHEDLAQGMMISKGELLFEVDDAPYVARAAQAKSEIKRLEGVLKRHDEEQRSLDERIKTVSRIVEINRDNYLATRRLFEDEGVGTMQQVAADEQLYLAKKDLLLTLEGQRALIPILKEETEALLSASRAQLDQAEFELANTKIVCPFDARVESATAFASQVVTPPLPIATLTNLEAFEISVGIDPREAMWLAPHADPNRLDEESAPGAGAEVVVRSTVGGQRFTWRGHLTRFERVDEATRTVRLVVEVRKEDMQAAIEASADGPLGERTLAIGMYCRTELPARTLEDALLVPRHAIHEDRWVYVFEPDPDSAGDAIGRLGRRRVPRLRSVRDEVLVDYRGRDGGPLCELDANEMVITSPLTKPVVGMPIRLRDERHASHAAEAETRLVAVEDPTRPSPAENDEATAPRRSLTLLGHTMPATRTP